MHFYFDRLYALMHQIICNVPPFKDKQFSWLQEANTEKKKYAWCFLCNFQHGTVPYLQHTHRYKTKGYIPGKQEVSLGTSNQHIYIFVTHILIKSLKSLQVNHRIVQVHNSCGKKDKSEKRITCQDDNPSAKERLSTIVFYDPLVIQLNGLKCINALEKWCV